MSQPRGPIFPPPLPYTPGKVVNITSVGPFNPGDILIVQTATMQANTPVITLQTARLDPAHFTVDNSTEPPTIRFH